MTQNIFVPGKIILSGEHAVVAGEPGIAVPASIGMTFIIEESEESSPTIMTDASLDHPAWQTYIDEIIGHVQSLRDVPAKNITIQNDLPAGKGMGSSTAMVIGLTRALIGDDEDTARDVERRMNPGNSGIDFAVIWRQSAQQFQKGTSASVTLPENILQSAILIDTGVPGETTPELVAFVQERKEKLHTAFAMIGNCTRRLLKGESLLTVLPDHHRAQVEMGVVTEQAQKIIAGIEAVGGAGKVLGAGARTGGSGMILAVHPDRNALPSLLREEYPVIIL